MFTEIISTLARERAAMARDAEYIKENVKDSDIQETILQYESAQNGMFFESDIVPLEMKKEICDTIEKIPNDPGQEEEEIERILSCEKDTMSLDEVMGIKSDPVTDLAPMVDAAAELAMEIDTSSDDVVE